MQTVKQYITLVEIDLPLLVDPDLMINHISGVWRYDITFEGNGITFDDGLVLTFPEHSENTYNIQSLEVDDIDFTRTSSIDNLILQDKAFYYDQGSGYLYITFEDYNPPLDSIIRAGAVTGFSKGYDTTKTTGKAYYNNIFYEPLVTKLPSIKKSRDPLVYGVMRFTNYTIEFDNNGGSFDQLTSEALFGAGTRVKLGEAGDSYDDFRTCAEGKIRKYKRDSQSFSIDVIDDRYFLDATVIENRFDQSTYTGLDDNDVDKPIPWLYGPCRNVPCTHLGSGQFMVADTTYHDIDEITTVYVDGESTVFSDTGTSASGIFSIGGYTEGDVTADVRGYVDDDGDLIDNTLDVIVDILDNRLNLVYSSDNYFQGEWSAEKNRTPDVAVFIDDETKIKELIEDLASGTNGTFYQRDDGKFSFRTFNENREPRLQIEFDEYLNDNTDSEYSTDFCVAKLIINYNQDYEKEEYQVSLIDDYADDVFSKYGVRNQFEIDTYIQSITWVENIGAKIAEYNNTVRRIINIKTKMQNIMLEVGDHVIATGDRRQTPVKDYDVYEIISKNINLDDYTIAFSLRYVKPFNEVDTLYTQGELYSNSIYGDTLHAVTLYEVA